jgi:hypothetical protein
MARNLLLGVIVGLIFWCVCSTASAAPGESSFTPTSLKVPVHFIRLESSTNANASVDLYRCPAEPPPGSMMPPDAGVAAADLDGGGLNSADACLVDMADNAALAALFADAIDVRLGTYDRIRVYLCGFNGATSYTSYVKGTLELNGTTYYTTDAHDEVLTQDSAHIGYTPVEYGGCASDVPLPAPLTIKDGDTIAISAFFSLRNIAWGTLTGNGPPGGCTFNGAHSHSVCTGYPIPVTYVGATSPTLETYYITEDLSDTSGAKAGGQLLLLLDAMGQPFGGFSRRLYSETSVGPSVNYDTPIKSIRANSTAADDAGTATYTIDTWGGGSAGHSVDFYIRFPEFSLSSHTGSLLRSDGVSTASYRAVRQ